MNHHFRTRRNRFRLLDVAEHGNEFPYQIETEVAGDEEPRRFKTLAHTVIGARQPCVGHKAASQRATELRVGEPFAACIRSLDERLFQCAFDARLERGVRGRIVSRIC